MSLLPGRYNVTNLLKALSSPRMVAGELNRLGMKVNRRIQQSRDDGDCVDVMDRDWDNCYILDACRMDLFEEANYLAGDLQTVTSCASNTQGFLHANFQGRTFHDTVYVTANPNVYSLDEQIFHATKTLYRDEWDEEVMTVPPETVAEAAREAHAEYPNKRLLVHFMQPHTPFIGDLGKELPQKHHRPGESADPDEDVRWIWGNLQYGLFDLDEARVWDAYRENLELALAAVEPLLEDVPGKSVVTSDHGNLVGERMRPIPVRMYGHPEGLRSPALVEVPWLEVDGETRRSVTSEPPEADQKGDRSDVEAQLNALGYR